ncbi:hypothetical protein [Acinetobacter rathckeae]|uniref:hypothetical protein n=1 Tax=Acinetobacter rathckeae TaxID=2605272 RepID=UPI0018A2C57A|nr:hypothetical protein [Acinetobacter rathckeae]MBF7686936.1 hypothetical protein [Acinetobacter rathckeae]MBF7694660.1 hypothetical protein [Acinetobacter rathckeae]
MKRTLLLSQLLLLTMAGCSQLPKQTTQPISAPAVPSTPPIEKNNPPTTENGVVVTPYPTTEIKKEVLPPPQVTTVVVPTKQPPARPVQVKSTASQPHSNQPPAVQNLMNQAQQAFKQQQIDRAEHLALQAQRISPQSSDSYALLAQVALRKNNIAQAQALAQRAASLTSDLSAKKQLWTLVLQTAQQQNNTTLVSKAQSVLSSLP